MSHRPTAEQAAIVDASTTGQDLVVEAGAGTGKTSTLKLLAAANPRRRGVYTAFGKAIVADAKQSFPRSVNCATNHSLAFGAVGRRYRHRLDAPRVPLRETARLLRINEPVRVSDDLGPLAPNQLARLAQSTVERFCYSADREITRWHVPRTAGLDTPLVRAALVDVIVPIARRAWDDLSSLGGQLRFTPDCYLKLWALSDPQLPGDYILLDEAQDANPAIAGVVDIQRSMQRILVGDRSQAIFGWRGATDAMATFGGRRLQLSQSFRFGPAIAAEANKWLAVLDAPLRLTGHAPINSEVFQDGGTAVDAILCRTNAEAVRQASGAINVGIKTALVGGGDDIRRLAEAAIELQAGRGCGHPDLMAFQSWAEVEDYVMQDAAGGDLAVAVKLINDHTAEGVLQILGRLVNEDQAELILSTAHKAKGREWGTVRIADDFREPRATEERSDPQVPREDAMLAYVAVTRAKQALDRSGLAWVDRWAPAHLIDRPSAAAVREGDILEEQLRQIAARQIAARQIAARQIAARQIPPAVVAAAVDIDWPEPVPVDEPAGIPDHLDQETEVDHSESAYWKAYCGGCETSPCTGACRPVVPELSPDCRRCGHHHTACTCTLMPDRRPLTAVTR